MDCLYVNVFKQELPIGILCAFLAKKASFDAPFGSEAENECSHDVNTVHIPSGSSVGHGSKSNAFLPSHTLLPPPAPLPPPRKISICPVARRNPYTIENQHNILINKQKFRAEPHFEFQCMLLAVCSWASHLLKLSFLIHKIKIMSVLSPILKCPFSHPLLPVTPKLPAPCSLSAEHLATWPTGL